MKYLKYFLEFFFSIIAFTIFKILGPSISSNIGGIIFEKIGPLFRSKKNNSFEYQKSDTRH